MQLTLHTDYALRVLIFLSRKNESLATITEIADFYHISRNHLVKVVHHLSGAGFIQTTRGKHGGMKLARPVELISIGDVVRKMEPNFNIVECFNEKDQSCVAIPACALKAVLHKASNEFLGVLDRFTLADAIEHTEEAIKTFPLEQMLHH